MTTGNHENEAFRNLELQTFKSEFIDFITNGVKQINTDHTHIHDGEAFSFDYKATNVANGANVDIQLKTGDTKYVHFKPFIITSDSPNINIQLIEAPTITDGTTPVTLINRNRVQGNEFDTTAFSDPSAISGGTVIQSQFIGGGSGGFGFSATASGGSANNDNEFVLAQSTDYLIRVTNNSGDTANILISVFGYEETYGQN